MTREQYHLLAPKYNRRNELIKAAIKQIPGNVNPTGRTFKRLVREITNNLCKQNQ